ncbi:hypothetical protein DMC30DRAFT_399821, partial [Rhodotorula diobovata]
MGGWKGRRASSPLLATHALALVSRGPRNPAATCRCTLCTLPRDMLNRRQATKEAKTEYYQIAQYTCTYDAAKKAVDCLPFVRTFMRVGTSLKEVTPTVNAGGRLPRGGLLAVPTDVEAPQCVSLVASPSKSLARADVRLHALRRTVPVKGAPPTGM